VVLSTPGVAGGASPRRRSPLDYFSCYFVAITMQTSNPRVTRKSHWERVSGSKAHACLPTEWGGYRDNERDSRRAAELAHFNRHSTAGELTASIAHELNQPLGAIPTNVETAEILLKSSAPDLDELREIVTDIRRDDQRASNVLQRLRSLLKKAPSEIKDVDLNELAGESIQLLSPLSIAREVKLNGFTAPMSLPIRGDPVQLQQVIVNLIVNAMDAMSKMPRAERRVTVDTARADNFAEVSVSDTGPGIPSEKIKEVFEPFFTTKAQGMGLGLSIARTIVEAHNGRIWADNKAGGGAVFHVSLPLSAT